MSTLIVYLLFEVRVNYNAVIRDFHYTLVFIYHDKILFTIKRFWTIGGNAVNVILI